MLRQEDQELQEALDKYNTHHGHATIMYDIIAQRVWTDLFESDSDWKAYDKHIIPVVSKTKVYCDIHGNNPVVREYVVEKIDEGINLYKDLQDI